MSGDRVPHGTVGFSKRLTTMPQKQNFPHLLGSKWTACESTFGWRHFQVVNRKNESSWVFAEMESSCDPTVKFWINAKVLKDGRRWMPGWKTLEELGLAKTQAEEEKQDGL